MWLTCVCRPTLAWAVHLLSAGVHVLPLLLLCVSTPGTMSRAEIESGYAISRRIEAEERALDAALLVFTSTQQEVKDQWGLYDG